jgi:hypothetical protein
MELDLQGLFGLHVHSYTQCVRPCWPPTPAFGLIYPVLGLYWSAKMDEISLSHTVFSELYLARLGRN